MKKIILGSIFAFFLIGNLIINIQIGNSGIGLNTAKAQDSWGACKNKDGSTTYTTSDWTGGAADTYGDSAGDWVDDGCKSDFGYEQSNCCTQNNTSGSGSGSYGPGGVSGSGSGSSNSTICGTKDNCTPNSGTLDRCTQYTAQCPCGGEC